MPEAPPQQSIPVRARSIGSAFALLVLGISSLAPAARAQDLPSISLNELGYTAKRWTVSNGLPLERIVSIDQTTDGFLWVGTRQNALARFDGKRFKAFNNDEITGEPRVDLSGIFLMYADRSGRLWFVIGDDLLLVREAGKFRRFGPEDGADFKGGGIVSITEGRDDDIWLELRMPGSNPRIIYRYRHGRFDQMELVAGPPCLVSTVAGDVWTMKAGQPHRLDDHSLGSALTPPQITATEKDPALLTRTYDGGLAISSLDGIFTREQGDWKLTHPYTSSTPQHYNAKNPQQSPDGYFWLKSTIAGLVVRLHDGTLRNVELPSLAMPSAIESVFCDREGNVWLGSAAGLFQLSPTPFVTWQMNAATPGVQVHTIGEDAQNRMWFAARGGVYHLPPDGNRIERVGVEPKFDEWYVAGTPGGGALLSTRSRLPRLWRPGSVLTQDKLRSGSVARSNFFLSRRTGDLLAINIKGIHRMAASDSNTMTLENLFTPQKEDRPFTFASLTEDSRGRLYMANDPLGLIRFDPETGLSHLSDKSAPNRAAMLPTVDRDDNVWAITLNHGGIGLWDGAVWFSVTWESLGFPVDGATVKGIICDDHDGLWVTTDRHGIFRAAREPLLNRLQTGARPVPWNHFGLNDGLASESGSFHHPGAFRDSKGRLWFATNAGASVTDPGRWLEARERLPAPPVVMDSISIDGSVIDLDPDGSNPNTLTVEPGKSRLEFHYAALHFATPAKVEYRYRLQGYEGNWVEAGNQRHAAYQRVPPGDYLFRVIASNGHGKWNEIGASLALVIKPFWWQTATARVFAIGLLIALVWLLVWLRLRYLHANHARQVAFSRSLINTQEAERRRIALELHDGLGQGLLLIKNSANLTLRRHRHDERVERRLKEMSELASAAVREVRTITVELRPPELDTAGLTAALEAMTEKVERHSDCAVEAHIADIDDLWDAEHSIHLYRLVQECLNNALRHSEASRIEVRVRRGTDDVTVLIEDNGRGFSTAERDAPRGSGTGLKGVRERVKYLGGELTIDSAPDAGTSIRFFIPTSDVPPDPHPDR